MRLSPDQRAELIARYGAGESADALATAFSVARTTVFKTLKRTGKNTHVKQTARTPEQEAEIARRYAAGENGNAISVALGIPISTVRRVIERSGVEIRPSGRVELDDDQRRIVAGMCATGSSIDDAARAFDVSRKTVDRILREYDVEMSLGRRPSCTVNHAAFDALTPESCYWAGFLFADGSVVEDEHGSPAVALHIAERDRGHVEKFRAFLKSDHAIVRITSKKLIGGPSVFYKVRSKQLSAALRALGMRKKNEDRAPVATLADSRDFWRGVIDGDGSVGSAFGCFAAFWLYGHPALLTAFRDWLDRNNLANLRVATKKNGSRLVPSKMQIYTVCTMGTPAQRTIAALYDNTAIALNRKLVIAQKFL